MTKQIKMIHHFDKKGDFVYATMKLPDKEYLKRKKRRKMQQQSRRINRKP